MKYTFGAGTIAAKRLELIAQFFNPLAAEFIRGHLPGRVERILDLGCGPGFTTGMLAENFQVREVVGYDQSDNFLDQARENFPSLTFIKHNITSFPFPHTGDLIYVRFILSHLGEIPTVLKGWLDQLNPGGVLILDEMEDVITSIDSFQKYLRINESMIANQGADLFIGRSLEKHLEGLNVRECHSFTHPVPDWQAASWFYPNSHTIWEKDEYVLSHTTFEEREEIRRELRELMQDYTGESRSTWKMKRVALTTS